ncbi:hypothetical protein BC829DRAFT_359363 [Chytridium lagenaria]|nr:hypothetical protein BC829DRAFT_359363 [Chytridium lagenaria]
MTSLACSICTENIASLHVEASGKHFHNDCFVCYQCLEPFKDGIFFEAEGGFFCEKDFSDLHGPRCAYCGDCITGRFISAMEMQWHPDHFFCSSCAKTLTGSSFSKKNGRPFCKGCYGRLKEIGYQEKKDECQRCKRPIEAGQLFMWKNQKVHVYHFSCSQCKQVLDTNCKEYDGKLFCPTDYAKIVIYQCFACHEPIKSERSIEALGNRFHIQCFICEKCKRPFPSGLYWDYKNKTYCEEDYNKLLGSICGFCNEISTGAVVAAHGRQWCEEHFLCNGCHANLTKIKFVYWDHKIFCKTCFDSLPRKIREVLHVHEEQKKKGKLLNTSK